MKYAILTLDNPEREKTREGIRKTMDGYEEVFIETVRGLDAEQLAAHVKRYGFRHKDLEWRPGEAGLWYSNINAWTWCVENDEALMVFEDDALPNDLFAPSLEALQVPHDYDFVSFYTPYRSFTQQLRFKVEPTNQEHGNICILYSPTGARKILKLLARQGLKWPVDIWLYKMGKAKRLRGYTPAMTGKPIIDHDWSVPTTIHEDERVRT